MRTKEEIFDVIKNGLKEHLGTQHACLCDNIKNETNLEYDLGLDSIDRFSLLTSIETLLDFRLTATEDAKFNEMDPPTVGNIVDFVYDVLKNKKN
jgi:acyl carrier protein